MSRLLAFTFLTLHTFLSIGQNNQLMYENTEYQQIPSYEAEYSANTVVARMIDGLIYRLYWATEELTPKDLEYRPEGEGTKTIDETMDHMHGLALTIRNTCLGQVNRRPMTTPHTSSFAEKRLVTFALLKQASETLKDGGIDAADLKIVFERNGTQSEFPFWNLINGQISDAIYHTGQIVSYRRSSGNPIDPMVNVFTGKNRGSN